MLFEVSVVLFICGLVGAHLDRRVHEEYLNKLVQHATKRNTSIAVSKKKNNKVYFSNMCLSKVASDMNLMALLL